MIPFGPRRLRGCVASRHAALLSPRCASWLSHRLWSSSHCAALSSSCRSSWLSHCLSPSSRCATLSSSRAPACCCIASPRPLVAWPTRPLHTLTGCFVTSSCAALSWSRGLVVSWSCRLVISSSRRAALSPYPHASWLAHHLSSSSRCAALLSSHRAGWLLRCLSLHPPLVLSSCRPSFNPPSPRHSPSPTPSNTVKCCRCH